MKFLNKFSGVDDAYLMIHSWQRICADRLQLHRNNIPGMHNSLRDRIAEMMVDVGPSITITSLTNVLAFVVGIFSPTPEIQLFCAGNAMAIFFDFVYQLFLFGPIVALAGRFEIQAEKHKLLLFETAERRSIWETRREMLKEKVLFLCGIKKLCIFFICLDARPNVKLLSMDREWIHDDVRVFAFARLLDDIDQRCTQHRAEHNAEKAVPRRLFNQ